MIHMIYNLKRCAEIKKFASSIYDYIITWENTKEVLFRLNSTQKLATEVMVPQPYTMHLLLYLDDMELLFTHSLTHNVLTRH